MAEPMGFFEPNLMKKLTLTLLALLAPTLTGCEEPTKEQRDAEISRRIEEFSYRGHEYLLYEKYFGKGVSQV